MPARIDARVAVVALSLIACTSSSGGSKGSGADGGTPGSAVDVTAVCSALSAYSQRCPPTGRCAQAQAMYCSTWAPSFSAAFREGLKDCFAPAQACIDAGSLFPSKACLVPHLGDLSPAQAKVKTDFCAQCPDGASRTRPLGCTNFFSLDVDDAGNSASPGTSVLLLNDDLVTMVDAKCTGPGAPDAGTSDCAQAFQNCALSALFFDANLPAPCTDATVTTSTP
ncbi:MAG TPA: hypothetical protein VKU41_26895 [Polyangiaceae bacterium]|nr:hypothetical protein [Polyangiaceae bacterium]